MHIRHVFFILHSAFFILVGCSESHLVAPADAGSVPMGDAYVVPGHDSGYYIWPDSGPAADDAGSDAGSDAAAGPDLTVTLNTYRLGDRMVGRGTSYVWMTLVELTAGASDVTLMGMRAHHHGTGSTDDISNVFLYSCAGRFRLTTGRSVNAATGEVTFHYLGGDGGLTIPAGGTVPLAISVDYSYSATAGTTHGFDIESADDFITSRPVVIAGAFPLRGGVVTVSPILPTRADINLDGLGADIVYGERGIISRFTITGENVYVDRINLVQMGSISIDSLQDLQLFVDGVPSGDAYTIRSLGDGGPFIALDFDNPDHTGVQVNGTSTVTVTALVTDPGYAFSTIRTYIEYPTDAVVGDTSLSFDGVGSNGRVCIGPMIYEGCDATGVASFDGSTPGNYFEIRATR